MRAPHQRCELSADVGVVVADEADRRGLRVVGEVRSHALRRRQGEFRLRPRLRRIAARGRDHRGARMLLESLDRERQGLVGELVQQGRSFLEVRRRPLPRR